MREPERRDLDDPQQRAAPETHRAATWRRYLRFWGPRVAADVDDELAFHFEMRVRDHVARGMTEADARAAVLHRLGALTEARAECVAITTRRERRMARAEIVDAFVQDVRFALRTLARQKGWATVAIATLALGIGANIAVFSVVNRLLLHPVDYPHADRVAIVYQEPTDGSGPTGVRVTITPQPDVVKAWREGTRTFEDIEPWSQRELGLLQRDGTTASFQGTRILPSFPTFAGVRPIAGRVFSDADVAEGGHVALLAEGAWRARFGARRDVLGQSITLDGKPYTIVGVMSDRLRTPRLGAPATDVWLPLDLRERGVGLNVVGRLRPGVSQAAAARDLDSLAVRGAAVAGDHSRYRTRLMAPRELVGFHTALVMLAAAVGLVLLIACANVAHLLIARAAARQRELAIRAAIGAGRARLFRQLLTESLVLSVAGCAAGLAVGWVALRAIVATRPAGASELAGAHFDGATLLVTVGLSLATGLLFGLVGLLQAARYSTHETLKSGALATSASRKHHRARGLLVVSQMALSTTLLVGATLLVRSVIHLQTLEPGFRPEGLYTVQLNSGARAGGDTAWAQRTREAIVRARAVPGVQGVTAAGAAPPMLSFTIGALQIEGQPEPASGTTSFIPSNGIEPDYFRVMGIPLLQGTTFTDTSAAARQVVVNRGMARRYWGSESPIGKRLRVVFGGQGEWMTVVGVAGDAATGGLTMDASEPLLYTFGPGYSPALVVRAAPGASPMPAVRAAVSALTPSLPPASVASVADVIARSASGPRFTMLLLTIFTALALVLAAVGLYGVLAYAVAQRSREIGIRMALGASSREIARSVVGQGLMLALAGVGLGLLGAVWATKLIADLLYGVQPTDAASFAIGALVLVVTALVACIVPTRRAVAVDPLVAIRAE